MTPRHHQEPASPAATFPGYVEVSEIGQGAFATVLRAIEASTGRPVALKLLQTPAGSALTTEPGALSEAFAQEVRALGAVSNHPNIVTLYRPLSTPEGHLVLVLELCRESLAQRVRRAGPMSAQDVIAVGIKIAGALETAHRAGFWHRDVKPQNMLVTQFGEPALTDFGVAALHGPAPATEGVFRFTTLHAAPEVLEGGRISGATDVYGLASSMYQMVTGQPPFSAFAGEGPASVILRILRDPVRPIRDADVPVGLSDVLEAALAKEPRDRPASARALAEALRQIEFGCGWPATACVVGGEAPPFHGPEGKEAAAPSLSPFPDPASEAAPWVARGAPVTGPGQPVPAPSPPSVLVPQAGVRNVVTPISQAGPRTAATPISTVPISAVSAAEASPPAPPAPPPPLSEGELGPSYAEPGPTLWITAPAQTTPESVYEHTLLPGGAGLPGQDGEGTGPPQRSPRWRRRARDRKDT